MNLDDLYIEINASSNNFKVKNKNGDKVQIFYTLEDAISFIQDIKLHQNRTIELQSEKQELINHLTNAAKKNGELINILKEIVYNNNTSPAEEFLKELEPSFNKNHTKPNDFEKLTKKQQKILLENIPLEKGDVLYYKDKKMFLTFDTIVNSVLLCTNISNISLYNIDKKDLGEKLIPIYTIHQLWYFIENKATITISPFTEDAYAADIRNKDFKNSLIGTVTDGDKLNLFWQSTLLIIDKCYKKEP